jgi:hypothetical protein
MMPCPRKGRPVLRLFGAYVPDVIYMGKRP